MMYIVHSGILATHCTIPLCQLVNRVGVALSTLIHPCSTVYIIVLFTIQSFFTVLYTL